MNKGERSLVKTSDGFYLPLMRKGEELLLRREKAKLHIAMLGHKRIPSREGGIEIVVWKLSPPLSGVVGLRCYTLQPY